MATRPDPAVRTRFGQPRLAGVEGRGGRGEHRGQQSGRGGAERLDHALLMLSQGGVPVTLGPGEQGPTERFQFCYHRRGKGVQSGLPLQPRDRPMSRGFSMSAPSLGYLPSDLPTKMRQTLRTARV